MANLASGLQWADTAVHRIRNGHLRNVFVARAEGLLS